MKLLGVKGSYALILIMLYLDGGYISLHTSSMTLLIVQMVIIGNRSTM